MPGARRKHVASPECGHCCSWRCWGCCLALGWLFVIYPDTRRTARSVVEEVVLEVTEGDDRCDSSRGELKPLPA